MLASGRPRWMVPGCLLLGDAVSPQGAQTPPVFAWLLLVFSIHVHILPRPQEDGVWERVACVGWGASVQRLVLLLDLVRTVLVIISRGNPRGCKDAKRCHTASGPCRKEFFKWLVMPVSDEAAKGVCVGGGACMLHLLFPN